MNDSKPIKVKFTRTTREEESDVRYSEGQVVELRPDQVERWRKRDAIEVVAAGAGENDSNKGDSPRKKKGN